MPKAMEKTALEAPKPADPRETSQVSTLEFHADEIVGARDKMVGAINKAMALFNPNGNAATLVKNISANLQGDLQAATPENQYALQQAMQNWQTMGEHWGAISNAVTSHGTQIQSILQEFSQILQAIVSGGQAQQRTQAAFNAQEFENTRQQLLGAYKTLQALFEDEDLNMSNKAVAAQLKTFMDKSPEQTKKQWTRASLLWNDALRHWGELKQAVGDHPIYMNAAMKKVFQLWNGVAMGKPAQPTQPSQPQQKEPIQNLIAVMRQKAQMQGPNFLKQFDSIVQQHRDNPEALRPFLEKQLLGKTTASAQFRLASLLEVRTAAGQTFSIPQLMNAMERYYDDTASTFSGGTEMPELRPHMIKSTEVLNDVVKNNPQLKPAVDAWNRAIEHWAKIDEALEQHGPPMKEALIKSRTLFNQLLAAEETPAAQPAQQPAQQQQQMQASVKKPPKTLRYMGATYQLAADDE